MRDGKKIFGIGAVVIMILVAIGPAITGSELDITKGLGETYLDEYDLEFTIQGEPAVITDEPILKDGKTYSKYEIKYEIKNVGEKKYVGSVYVQVTYEGAKPAEIIDYWTETGINLKPGDDETRKHEVEVETSTDPGQDEERYFADNNIIMECKLTAGQDVRPINNVDFKKVKNFWKKNKEFEPTTSQILVSTPRSYYTFNKTINGTKYQLPIITRFISGISLEDLIDLIKKLNADHFREAIEALIDYLWNEVPEHFKNQRLGWVNRLSYYALSISVDILVILLRFGQFISNTWDDFLIIANWIKDICSYFALIVSTGVSSMALAGKILDETGEVFEAIIRIAENAVIWGGKIINATDVLLDRWTEFKEWRSSKPWMEKIRIYGRVDFLNEGETVTVKCREDGKHTETIEDDNRLDNNIIWYDFEVSPDSDKPKRPQKCVITVTGDKHKGNLQTFEVASYCFSGGEVYKWFQDDDWEDKAKNKIGNSLQDVLQNILKNIKNILALRVLNNPHFSF